MPTSTALGNSSKTDVEVLRALDKSLSPLLFNFCVDNSHLGAGILIVKKASDKVAATEPGTEEKNERGDISEQRRVFSTDCAPLIGR